MPRVTPERDYRSVAVVIRAYGSSPAVAYAGKAIHVAGNQIRHVIHVGLPPYTEDQVRRVRLTDNGTKLALATDTVDDRMIELHWERGNDPGPKTSTPL